MLPKVVELKNIDKKGVHMKTIIRKIIVVLMSLQLSLYAVVGVGDVVTDPGSYSYYMQQIAQVTKSIDLMTTQIKTLGGIRTAVDDTKRKIYNTKDNLENVMKNLKGSMVALTDAMSNAEVKSLWSIKRSSIGTGSGGLFYGDISKQIEAYFVAADDAVIKRMGGKEKFKKWVAMELYNPKKALSQVDLNDFKAVMGAEIDVKKVKKSLLVSEYLRNVKKGTREDVQQNALGNVQNDYNDFFYPTDAQKFKREEDLKRLESFTKYIQTSGDSMQQTQTTNLVLVEILNILNREYKSALKYRNAIASLHMKNINNPAYLARLVDNQKNMKEEIEKITNKVDNSKYSKLKKASSLGVGFRF